MDQFGVPATGRMSSRRLLAGLGAVVMVIVAVSAIHWLRTTSTSGACGGENPARIGGGTWSCAFDDEFNGTALNPAHWSVTTSAQSGYRSGVECYVNNPRTVSVANGVLSLSAIRLANPVQCRTPYGAWLTPYVSGMVTTQGHFAQAGGRYEIRAAFQGAQGSGVHSALWLYPEALTYGKGASGEIDLAEYYGATAPDLGFATLKYKTWFSGQSPTMGCKIQDPAAFHVYTLTWTSSLVTIAYDGQTCLSTQWSPAAPLAAPQPFDRPFNILLTQSLAQTGAGISPTLPFPVTMKVDYVRVWR
jgi:beta-glucanase (GH16 family)